MKVLKKQVYLEKESFTFNIIIKISLFKGQGLSLKEGSRLEMELSFKKGNIDVDEWKKF